MSTRRSPDAAAAGTPWSLPSNCGARPLCTSLGAESSRSRRPVRSRSRASARRRRAGVATPRRRLDRPAETAANDREPDAYLLYLQAGTLGGRSGNRSRELADCFRTGHRRDPVYAVRTPAGLLVRRNGILWVMPLARGISIGKAPPAAHCRSTPRSASRTRWLQSDGELSSRWAPPNHCFAARSSWIRTTRSRTNVRRYLRTLGRFDEAEAEMRRAVELDPLDPPFLVSAGSGPGVRGSSGRRGYAIREAAGARLDYPPAHYELAKALASQGDYDAAINEFATGARQWGEPLTAPHPWEPRQRRLHGARLLGATRSSSAADASEARIVPPSPSLASTSYSASVRKSMAWLRERSRRAMSIGGGG